MTARKPDSGKSITHNRNKFIVAMPDWMDNAACNGTPITMWFPEYGSNGDSRNAKDVCYECPVRQQCLEWAFATGSVDGIFGGYDARERKKLRRNAQRRQANQRVASA